MNLKEVTSEEYFFLSDGRAIKSIKQLASMLPSMNSEVFSFHANQEKNDFANWVKYVIKNNDLASKINSILDKNEMSKIIKDAINLEEHPLIEKKEVLKSESDGPIKLEINSHKLSKLSSEKISKVKPDIKKIKQISKIKLKKESKPKKSISIIDKYSKPVKTTKSKSRHKINLKKQFDYDDDYDVDGMISEINLGSQRDMLSRISSRIEKMNSELKDIELNKEKSSRKKSLTKSKSGSKKNMKPKLKTTLKKKAVKKVRTTRSDKLFGKYKTLMSTDIKKKIRLPKTHRAGTYEKSRFQVITKSDVLKGINDQFQSDSDNSSDTIAKENSKSTTSLKDNKKSSGGFFSRLFKSVDVSVEPSIKAMSVEKKAQETINILQNPALNINTIMDFMKGLLIGMILGMVFLLIF